MAKSKRKTEQRRAAADTPTARQHTDSNSPYLPTANPPRPNRLLLALAIMLFIAWMAVLAAISLSVRA